MIGRQRAATLSDPLARCRVDSVSRCAMAAARSAAFPFGSGPWRCRCGEWIKGRSRGSRWRVDPGDLQRRWAPCERAHGLAQGQLPLGSIRPRGYMSPAAPRSLAATRYRPGAAIAPDISPKALPPRRRSSPRSTPWPRARVRGQRHRGVAQLKLPDPAPIGRVWIPAHRDSTCGVLTWRFLAHRLSHIDIGGGGEAPASLPSSAQILPRPMLPEVSRRR